MCLHLIPIFTGQGDISEVNIFPQGFKGSVDILLEIIPFQTKLLRSMHGLASGGLLNTPQLVPYYKISVKTCFP